ncbi:pickpocket protein 28-like [Pieris napi]|uniref:pickpocket protein 28-like n=1 Tax=Pieris napi TaxID=78633 RepID=UPI001FB95958|nr:pickpocket protein 28-like [Pieris napi]
MTMHHRALTRRGALPDKGSGLLVVFTVEPSDYPPWALSSSYGAKVLINDPNDYPEYSLIYKRVYTEISLDIKVQPWVFEAEDSLRSIPKAYRGCAFHDEIELKHTDRYSSETCATECKMRSYLTYCGCVPYKYPQEATTRICEFKDLGCLNNLRAKKLSGEHCDPLCYLECRDKHYRVTSDIMPLVADLYPDEVMNNRNASELSALQVYFNRPTCNCYKQMLLMDFTSFIATYGGIFSLSFGASLLTLIEVVFLTLNTIVYYSCKSV